MNSKFSYTFNNLKKCHKRYKGLTSELPWTNNIKTDNCNTLTLKNKTITP